MRVRIAIGAEDYNDKPLPTEGLLVALQAARGVASTVDIVPVSWYVQLEADTLEQLQSFAEAMGVWWSRASANTKLVIGGPSGRIRNRYVAPGHLIESIQHDIKTYHWRAPAEGAVPKRPRQAPAGYPKLSSAFTAQRVGISDATDSGLLLVAIAEKKDGGGWSLQFQAEDPPLEDPGADGDDYCIVTDAHKVCYGGIAALSLASKQLNITFTAQAAKELGLRSAGLRITLDVDDVDVERLREGLRGIFAESPWRSRPEALELGG